MNWGLEIPDTYVRSADYLETKKDLQNRQKELLNLENPPTCIIYPDDTSLIGGRNVIIEMGLRIPRDISIAGYDGTMISQLLYPKTHNNSPEYRNDWKRSCNKAHRNH